MAPKFNLRPRSIQSRIALYFAVLLIGVLGGVLIIVDRAISDNARSKIKEELQIGERVFRRLLEQNTRQLTQAAEVLSRDFAFREAVASNDTGTIQSALQNHGLRIGAALMMLAAPDHKLIADTQRSAGAGKAFAFPWLIAAAEAAGRSGGMVLIEGRAYQLVVVPVLAPAPIAWAAFGFPIDDRLARELQDLTGLQVSFLSLSGASGWKMLASTLAEGLQQRVRDGVAAAPVATPDAKLSMGGYESLLLPLEQRPEFVIVAVLQRSLDEALAPFRQLQTLLMLLALGGLSVTVGLSVLIARGITKPIQALTDYTRRVEEGDYSQAVTIPEQGEIGNLARQFNLMREGIAAREAQILRLAYRDVLTDLPNRTLFNERLSLTLDLARRAGTPVTVLLMDLDRFKYINDALGHLVGDQTLQQVARRISGLVRRSDTTARLGGDEFAILLADADIDEAVGVVKKILAALEEPIVVSEQLIDVGASIGISGYPKLGRDEVTLLRQADAAMYAAKRSSSGYAVFDPQRHEQGGTQLSLLGDLRRAIDRNELKLLYQPKIEVSSGSIVGVECLVRWNHPERGLVPPVHFIPFAEQTGFIKVITQWVLQTAVAQCGAWRSRGIMLRIAVNISAQDLVNPHLADLVPATLQRHRVPVDALTLEITESSVMQEPARAIDLLRRLNTLGVSLSIDDFGTGYSSLAYLKQLPVHELKIDRSFIRNIVHDRKDRAIVLSTIELGHNLGLSVVAEGVEDAPSLDMLRHLGCDFAQGYLIARPLDEVQLLEWISERARLGSKSAVT